MYAFCLWDSLEWKGRKNKTFQQYQQNIYYNIMSREKERQVHKELWKTSIVTRALLI